MNNVLLGLVWLAVTILVVLGLATIFGAVNVDSVTLALIATAVFGATAFVTRRLMIRPRD